jgi:phage shock protein A
MAPLRAQYMDLTRTEEKLTADSQRLIGWIESFRSRKEALKAAYTAAEAQRAVNAAFAGLADEGEEAEVPTPMPTRTCRRRGRRPASTWASHTTWSATCVRP